VARNYYTLPGDRIYPFAYVGFNMDDLPTLLRRRKNGGGWTTITGSGYTDDIQEAKLFTEVVDIYLSTPDVHDLEVTDSSGTYNITTNVYSRIKAGHAKVGTVDRKIAPFVDVGICTDDSEISAINYSVSGDTVIAKTLINTQSGVPYDVVAKRFVLSFSSAGTYICTLYATDQSAHESTTNIVVTIG